jgi:hypothetical protein
VIESLVRGPEEFAEGLAAVERCVVLARHEVQLLRVQAGDDVAEPGHALAALLRVVGAVRQVAGKADEVGRLGQRIDGRHGPGQRRADVGVGIALAAPVRIGELNEMELLADPGLAGGGTPAERAGRVDDPAEAGESKELSALGIGHRCLQDRLRLRPACHTFARPGRFPHPR